ncbi:virulence RhuM family protein [Ectopseudomonas oleovorans]|uniref:virulence RhuM family protein n=1 Tax=Ectopseudomonas oleovorans TaxID=301 RepID=UPI0005040717|nr:virulence RhuM family protein [Pseudomonas oleovorans]KFJ92507.1 2-hydroxyacid dehydrogenase [Pseudomonas sp. 1-7]MBN7120012.1 2-hydroxyacid dehydrogenase [Pseudomonas oleovorans]MBN7130903.1 2-hydroxyacid dehydrogenase [Pseudomonas oleovorans]MBN7141508.1 2-hydroxyacid dehydrogenase [Pseudomonas oleovorans]
MSREPGAGNTGDILLYESQEGRLRLEVRLQDETLWLTQQQLAELFQTTQQNVSQHIRNIYDEGELEPAATHKKFLSVRREGSRDVRRQRDFYNLDVIISVGYRVKSAVATRFRIWATERLKEYIVKGFALDDQRLKEPDGGRYFEELLARIRDIRASEKVFWRKVLDIYATSIDYDPHTPAAQLFFKQVQNKMHWAAHGHTAAELIHQRADASLPNMGITHFAGNKLLKRDVEIAKNYLSEEELGVLNRLVTAYLELAEIQALNRQPMSMADWQQRLDQFLTMTGRELLDHAGSISHQAALDKAHQQYEQYRQQQLQQPTEVEKHFVEAESRLKRLGVPRKP